MIYLLLLALGIAPTLDVQMHDGALVFHLPGEGYHDAVVRAADGRDLGAREIGEGLWKSSPAPSGTFSVILCTPTTCTPVDFTWEIDGYVEPPPAKVYWSVAVAMICSILVALFLRFFRDST